jgi:hypothetical protein
MASRRTRISEAYTWKAEIRLQQAEAAEASGMYCRLAHRFIRNRPIALINGDQRGFGELEQAGQFVQRSSGASKERTFTDGFT